MKRAKKRLLKIVGGLIVLLLLFYLVEGWRGARALAETRQFLVAGGEDLQLSAGRLEPVSQSDNFFAVAQLAPLFDFSMEWPQGEITFNDQEAVDRYLAMRPPAHLDFGALYEYRAGELNLESWVDAFERAGDYDLGDPEAPPADRIHHALARFDEDFSALAAAAAERPLSRFPVQPASSAMESYVRTISAYPRGTFGFHEFLVMNGIVALERNDPATALDCIRIQRKFSQAFAAEPTLMALLLRAGCLPMAQTLIHHGLASDCWSADDLEWIDRQLADIDLLDHGLRAARGELRYYLAAVEHGKSTGELPFSGPESKRPFAARLLPAGWWDQNAATGADLIYRHSVLPFKSRDFTALDDDGWGNALETTTPYNILARPALYSWRNVAEDILMGQAAVEGLRIACALERLRIATGRYPDSLDELTPAYLQAIPKDPFQGTRVSMQAEENGYHLSSPWKDKASPDDDWTFEFVPDKQRLNGNQTRDSVRPESRRRILLQKP